MFKKNLVSFTLLLLILFVAGCSGGESKSSSKTSDNDSDNNATEITELDLATAATRNDLKVDTLLEFAENVEKETDGGIKINIHADGVLGTENETLEQVRTGAIDIILVGGLSHFEQYDPSLGIDELPFAFETHQDAYDALDGKVGDLLEPKIEDLGFKNLAYWENGYRHFTNDERPINTPEDLKGLKMRIAETDLRLKTFKALGASVTPMDFTEVYTGLQQGVIDGQDNPLSLIYSSKFYEVQKHLSISGHLWGSNPLAMNLDTWNSLSPENKEILKENAIKYQDIQRQRLQESDEELIKVLEEEGMQINEVDVDSFKEVVQPIWDDARETFGDDVIDALEEFR